MENELYVKMVLCCLKGQVVSKGAVERHKNASNGLKASQHTTQVRICQAQRDLKLDMLQRPLLVFRGPIYAYCGEFMTNC